MGMGIGANDVSNMMNKAQSVGYAQTLRADQQIKETDRSRETERARDANPEASTVSNTQNVGSSAGATRTGAARRNGEEARGLQRLNRGSVEWQQERDSENGTDWLPPSLQPQSRTAGANNANNIPYWLSYRPEQKVEENPTSAHRRLLNGLKNMCHTEIQQYVKTNEPPYAKKALREIYGVLRNEVDGGSGEPAAHQTLGGEPSGISGQNWQRAESSLQMLDNPPVEAGAAFEMVA